MSRVTHTSDFFVVGGAVQPGRDCYIERRAEEALLKSVADQQFSYVLSPRASGKSSLVARTISALRERRQLAAVVDLTQIGARSDSDDAGRWYYSIAYRVLRELRLKADLQAWWQGTSVLLNEQRLVEFFSEVVLAHTFEPVTIFFDEIERAEELPFAKELFSAIRTCYARRVSEPDFNRLNFVVLGVTTPARLCPDESWSPFTDGRGTELPDFSAAQCHRFAAGFGLDEESGRALMDRIYGWTRGQPYLTQKLARAVARKGGKLADVDRCVQELFFAPRAGREEPLLSQTRSLLTRKSQATRQALSLLEKVGRGGEIAPSAAGRAHEFLSLAGVVNHDDVGRLRYRNRIYERVFDGDWAASARPIDWRRPVALAAAAAVVMLLPFWYLQVLPRPYIDILSVVTEDYAVAQDAYQALHRIPGFAGRADRLLAEATTRRSRSARTLDEVLAADAVLRSLPERAGLADELTGAYWLRRSREAMHREQRDEALLLAVQALRGQREAVHATAAELIGPDYRQLVRSFRLTEPPLDWRVDWQRAELVVIDQAHRVQHLELRETPEPLAVADVARIEPIQGRLTALRHVPVERELVVDEGRLAGGFDLLLTLRHDRASDLLVTLTAPSGGQATLAVPQPRADQQALRFSARPGSPLFALADEDSPGLWRLTAVDRRSDEVGVLLSWGLQFSGDATVYTDTPEQGVALPDPVRTDAVEIDLDATGRVALARPSRPGTGGALAVWDLLQGELVGDLPIDSPIEHVLYSSEYSRAIVTTADELELTVWDAGQGVPPTSATSILTSTDFAPPPVLSADGDYFAIAFQHDSNRLDFLVKRVDDGMTVGAGYELAVATDWVLGPGARYLALVDPAGRVRIVAPDNGRPIGDLRHARPIERLITVPTQDTLIAVDSAGDLLAWRIEPVAAPGLATRTPVPQADRPDELPATGQRIPGPIDSAATQSTDDPVSAGLFIPAPGVSFTSRADPGAAELSLPEPTLLGRTIDPASVSVAADATVLAFEAAPGLVQLRNLDGEASPGGLRLDPGVTTRLSPDGRELLTVTGETVFRFWSLEPPEYGSRPDPELSALALDSGAEAVAFGYRGGHVRVRPVEELEGSGEFSDSVDFIGHRGAVTSLALNATGSLVASGGADGVVRAWDSTSVAPGPAFMRHPAGPVRAVQISADGRWIVSAAEYSARIWSAQDGELVGEIPVNGSALAVAFSPEAELVAVGDSAGNIFFGAPRGSEPLLSTRAQAAVRAIAFSPDATFFATGDSAGNLQLWDAGTASARGDPTVFPHAIEWLDFSPDTRFLLARSGHWMHRLELIGEGFAIVDTRLLPGGLNADAVLGGAQAESVRLVGGRETGRAAFLNLGLTRPADAPLPADSPQLTRDWQAILGLTLDTRTGLVRSAF